MKLTLHIGQSKTGTTSIQHFLFNNKKELLNQKILFPDYKFKGIPLNTWNHNAFASICANENLYPSFSFEDYVKEFFVQSNKSNSNNIILSAENFWGTPHVWFFEDQKDFWNAYKYKLLKLKKFTNNFETDIICYLRDPLDWFQTNLSHMIINLKFIKKDIYKSDDDLFLLLKPYLNYPKIINLWKIIIKPKKFILKPFNNKTLSDEYLIQDFCINLNIDFSLMNFDKSKIIQNKSFDRRLIEVRKYFNQKKIPKQEQVVINECLSRMNSKFTKIEKYQINNSLRENIKNYCRSYYILINKNNISNFEKFFDNSVSKNIKQKSLTSKEIEATLYKFDEIYKSFSIKIFRIYNYIKAFLRYKVPILSALLRVLFNFAKNNLISKFEINIFSK